MKKLIFFFFLAISYNTFSQNFAKYSATELKDSGSENDIEVKHIAPAKMISFSSNGEKTSFYFDTDGTLKAVSGKGFSLDIKSNEVTLKENGNVTSKETPKADFLEKIKNQLSKALNLLKK